MGGLARRRRRALLEHRDRPERRHDRPLPPARRKARPLRGDPLPLLRRRPLAGRRPATRRGQANAIGRDRERRPREPRPTAKSPLPPDGRPGTESKERRPAACQPRPGTLRRSLRGSPDGVSHDLEELSPLAGEEKISVPVELATGPRDAYFPPSESYALERVAPQRRVTVTPALDHAELDVSPRDIPAFLTFDGVRGPLPAHRPARGIRRDRCESATDTRMAFETRPYSRPNAP